MITIVLIFLRATLILSRNYKKKGYAKYNWGSKQGLWLAYLNNSTWVDVSSGEGLFWPVTSSWPHRERRVDSILKSPLKLCLIW